MYIAKTNRVFVVTTEGDVLGVINLADICKDILKRHGKMKSDLLDRVVSQERADSQRFLNDFCALTS